MGEGRVSEILGPLRREAAHALVASVDEVGCQPELTSDDFQAATWVAPAATRAPASVPPASLSAAAAQHTGRKVAAGRAQREGGGGLREVNSGPMKEREDFRGAFEGCGGGRGRVATVVAFNSIRQEAEGGKGGGCR